MASAKQARGASATPAPTWPVPALRFKIPVLGNVGTPLGVDARKVAELGITPAVTTGILHRSAGTGQVGAGVAEAPLACFAEAIADLDRRLTGPAVA